jgi:hypothetical protein
MLIKLFRKQYHAFMVSGAIDSFISQEVANELRASCVPFREQISTIYLTDGSTEITGYMTCNIGWAKGNVKQTFLVVPSMARPIILGLDFLYKCQVVVDIAGSCWFTRRAPDERIAFAEPEDQRPRRVELNESWVDRECACIPGEDRDKEGMRGVINKYRKQGVFTKKPGLVNGVEHEISTGNAPANKSRPRPMNASKRRILDDIMN